MHSNKFRKHLRIFSHKFINSCIYKQGYVRESSAKWWSYSNTLFLIGRKRFHIWWRFLMFARQREVLNFGSIVQSSVEIVHWNVGFKIRKKLTSRIFIRIFVAKGVLKKAHETDIEYLIHPESYDLKFTYLTCWVFPVHIDQTVRSIYIYNFCF